MSSKEQQRDDFLREIYRAEGLFDGRSSTPNLGKLKEELEKAGHSVEFGRGNRQLVILCGEHRISIILSYEGFETYITKNGQSGDVRGDGDVVYHFTQKEVIDEIKFFIEYGSRGFKQDTIGGRIVIGTQEEIDKWENICY